MDTIPYLDLIVAKVSAKCLVIGSYRRNETADMQKWPIILSKLLKVAKAIWAEWGVGVVALYTTVFRDPNITPSPSKTTVSYYTGCADSSAFVHQVSLLVNA